MPLLLEERENAARDAVGDLFAINLGSHAQAFFTMGEKRSLDEHARGRIVPNDEKRPFSCAEIANGLIPQIQLAHQFALHECREPKGLRAVIRDR